MLMSLRLNPEYSGFLPKMSDEEFAELKASIKAEGQHYPIIVNEDLEVLDGHHRYQACIELGIEPDFEVRRFDDKLLEKKFVIEANLRRRHLNNFQLVELAVPLLEIEKALAKKRKAKGSEDGGDLLMGTAQEDVEPEFKSKATRLWLEKQEFQHELLKEAKKFLRQQARKKSKGFVKGKQASPKFTAKSNPAKTLYLEKRFLHPFKSRLAPARFKTSQSFRVSWTFCKKMSCSVLHAGTRCLPAANAIKPCKSY